MSEILTGPALLAACRARLAEMETLEARIAPAPWGVNKYGAIGTGERFIFGGIVIDREGFDTDLAGYAPKWIVAARNTWDASIAVVRALVEQTETCAQFKAESVSVADLFCTKAEAALRAWLEAGQQ